MHNSIIYYYTHLCIIYTHIVKLLRKKQGEKNTHTIKESGYPREKGGGNENGVGTQVDSKASRMYYA